MRNTETIKISQLEKGHVVVAHGMRCLVDSEPIKSDYREGVIYTKALVLNRDEIASAAVPTSWTATGENGEHRWQIQSNDLADWAVETVKVQVPA